MGTCAIKTECADVSETWEAVLRYNIWGKEEQENYTEEIRKYQENRKPYRRKRP